MNNTIYAANEDFEIKKGDGISITVIFLDPNDSDNPLDLTQFTDLIMQVKHNKEDADFLFELKDPALVIGGADNNELSILLTSTETTLYPKDYFYDIQGNLSGGIRTILEGILKVSGDVTR
jgi:hypothetical protein